MELLDLYDDNGVLTGKVIQRGDKFTEGNIMLSIVFIKNSADKYLIQKTSKQKKSKYSSTGGHVISGEDSLKTIVREVKEELGLDINEEEFKHIGLIKNPNRPCLINLYLVTKDIDINDIKLQKEEVEAIYFLTPKEILDLIDDGKFLESHGYLFKNYIIK